MSTKKENLQNTGFAVPADLRTKLKESEKKDKYLHLARKPKKIWNIKMTVIPVAIDALSPVTKDWYKDRRT